MNPNERACLQDGDDPATIARILLDGIFAAVGGTYTIRHWHLPGDHPVVVVQREAVQDINRWYIHVGHAGGPELGRFLHEKAPREYPTILAAIRDVLNSEIQRRVVAVWAGEKTRSL